MSLDTIALYALAVEIGREVGGGVVRRLGQVGQEEFVVVTSRGTILVSVDRTFPRIHMTGASPEEISPEVPFMGTMRDALETTSFLGAEQIGFDRVLALSFGTGEQMEHRLICELIPRLANAILTDRDGRVVDAWKGGTLSASPGSRLSVGAPYVPPPRPCRALETGTLSEFADLQASRGTVDRLLASARPKGEESVEVDAEPALAGVLVRGIPGMSPLLAKEALHRAEITSSEVPPGTEALDRLADTLLRIAQDVRERRFVPAVYTERGTPLAIAAIPLTQFAGSEALEFDTMSEAVETFERLRSEAGARGARITRLARSIRTAIKRHQRLESRQLVDLEATEDADSLQSKGELILANLGRIRRGIEQIEVTEYHDEGERRVRVELEPELSPQENATSYFRRARKARRGRKTVESRIETARSHREALQTLSDRIERIRGWQAGSPEAVMTEDEVDETLSCIEDELTARGIALPRTARPAGGRERPELPRAAPRTFTTRGGLTVLVGRDNRENDRLTFKIARPRDIFLHARGVPGSHAILLTDNGRIQPQKSDIIEAAAIAAHFSRARSSGVVPVAYTERRHVHKPRGAAPGVVTLSRESVVFVEPAGRDTLK
jgi:predicted ribosome quality control (RQC) complex YloA/Tae2 family protein